MNGRGWYGSVRLPGGFRVGHRLLREGHGMLNTPQLSATPHTQGDTMGIVHAFPARNGRHKARENRTAIFAAIPVTTVALIAGVVSYTHIVALGMRAHQGSVDSHLLPFAVDGLIVAGVVIVLAGYWLGWFAVALGVAATVFANVESGLPHGPLAATIAAWPAVAFSVASFVLERWLKTQYLAETAHDVVTSEVPPVVTVDAAAAAHTDTASHAPVVTTPVTTPEALPAAHVDTTPEESVDTGVVTVEPVPMTVTRRRRTIPANATDDDYAARILEHAEDPAALTPYGVNKLLKEQCGAKQKLGDPRARRVIDLAQRQHRERRVVAIGERRA